MQWRYLQMPGWLRLLCGAAVGVAVGFGLGLLPKPLDGVARGLLGWCVGAAAYLLPAWWLAETCDPERTRARAQAQDQPSALILAIMVSVIGVSMVVIAMLLQSVPQLSGAQRIGHIALGLVALTGSWLMIHTIYAFHYAHRYYQAELAPKPQGPGLKFPGKLHPDYFDFLYSLLRGRHDLAGVGRAGDLARDAPHHAGARRAVVRLQHAGAGAVHQRGGLVDAGRRGDAASTGGHAATAQLDQSGR